MASGDLEIELRGAIRVRQLAVTTGRCYVSWYRRFVLFHGKKHPAEMGTKEVGEFLTHVAKDRDVSAATQVQALNALVFLYRDVLKTKLEKQAAALQARTPAREMKREVERFGFIPLTGLVVISPRLQVRLCGRELLSHQSDDGGHRPHLRNASH